MALNTTYAPVREAGNGSKVDFDFDFEVISASDLSVGKILNSTNVKTDMVLGVDYTVTLSTVTREGTVHYTVAPSALQDSWIGRAVPITQPTDIPTNNIFREVQVENALDRQAMISQQLEEKIGRALLLPDVSDLSDISIPTPEAGKALKWNATEDGLENSTYDPDIVGDYAAAAEASATAAAQSASDASDSADAASDSEDAAGASAIAAAASAASINMPLITGNAGKALVAKGDETGLEYAEVVKTSGNQSITGTKTFADVDLTKIVEKSNAVGASDIDLTAGSCFTRTISETTTFTFSNPPASGKVGSFTLILTNGGSATVNWPAAVKWEGGVAPTLTASGKDILSFFTNDGGTNYYGFLTGKDLR